MELGRLEGLTSKQEIDCEIGRRGLVQRRLSRSGSSTEAAGRSRECCHGMYLPVIESLNNSYYSDGSSAARACAGEDGDEAVLLHRKGTWIEREGPICERKRFCQKPSYRKTDNLNTNRTDKQLSKAHDVTPSTHARQVSTVRVGLSVGSTVSLTSSIG
ncbi:hypothetical protein IEQ34_026491 [Dendrobium chrysotoxum]|uniref:Uncharacterized protein n=1 Tax=Dendrobium chrysotoxum TaxID=161865 RepID=A0AAV7FM15_DENCH|nr:hypothetical protein IEQ34_026491 [Dendrobium chrysotoxum]